ncbi:hypothetical protein TWF506_005828 [Arthrobotrys conoides]|uniref:Uncharacterized protein n=1 Tax=Arthrobotrys conoides TaxID=74498 RepID=A0AAN8NCR3_9PEZI
MPPGYYTVEYMAPPESLKHEEIQVEFENAFRKIRYAWPGVKEIKPSQDGEAAPVEPRV